MAKQTFEEIAQTPDNKFYARPYVLSTAMEDIKRLNQQDGLTTWEKVRYYSAKMTLFIEAQQHGASEEDKRRFRGKAESSRVQLKNYLGLLRRGRD